MSAKGPSAASLQIVMDPDEVKDTHGSETVRIRTIIPGLANCTLHIETALTVDGPWRTLVSKTSVGETFDELECDPNATYRLDRYLRWRIVTTASSVWKVCFTQLGMFEPTGSGSQSVIRGGSVPGGVASSFGGSSETKSLVSGDTWTRQEGGR
jgi:hypothetical protein